MFRQMSGKQKQEIDVSSFKEREESVRDAEARSDKHTLSARRSENLPSTELYTIQIQQKPPRK